MTLYQHHTHHKMVSQFPTKRSIVCNFISVLLTTENAMLMKRLRMGRGSFRPKPYKISVWGAPALKWKLV
jgi:hypothetical protein